MDFLIATVFILLNSGPGQVCDSQSHDACHVENILEETPYTWEVETFNSAKVIKEH